MQIAVKSAAQSCGNLGLIREVQPPVQTGLYQPAQARVQRSSSREQDIVHYLYPFDQRQDAGGDRLVDSQRDLLPGGASRNQRDYF